MALKSHGYIVWSAHSQNFMKYFLGSWLEIIYTTGWRKVLKAKWKTQNKLRSLSTPEPLYSNTELDIKILRHTQIVTVEDLVFLASHIMHLHSLHYCWTGIVFACADLKEIAAEVAEWSQEGSLNLIIRSKAPVNWSL